MRGALVLLAITIMLVNSTAYAEVHKEYYPSGQLKLEYDYKDGEQEGIYKRYYETGQVEEEGSFKDGEQEGLRKGYYESGNISYIDTFKNGKWIHRKSYDEDGKLESDRDIPKLESERDYIQW